MTYNIQAEYGCSKMLTPLLGLLVIEWPTEDLQTCWDRLGTGNNRPSTHNMYLNFFLEPRTQGSLQSTTPCCHLPHFPGVTCWVPRT